MAAPSIRQALRNVSLFFFCRYPFVNGITLLMLLAERADTDKYPPYNPQLIYGHVAVFILSGIGMAFDVQRRNLALIHSGQLLMFSYSTYTNEKLGYREWVRIRIVLRYIALSGLYILYSFFITKPRNPNTRKIGEALVGIYLFALAYSLLYNTEDKTVFLKLFPLSEWMLHVIAGWIALSALAWLSGYFIHDVTQILVFSLSLLVLFMDLVGFRYWTRKRGYEWWSAVRVAGDDVTILLGLLVYLSLTKRRLFVSEADREACARKVRVEVGGQGKDGKSQ